MNLHKDLESNVFTLDVINDTYSILKVGHNRSNADPALFVHKARDSNV